MIKKSEINLEQYFYPDVVKNILAFLTLVDVVHLSQCSKKTFKMIENASIWEIIAKPHITEEKPLLHGESYKHFVGRQVRLAQNFLFPDRKRKVKKFFTNIISAPKSVSATQERINSLEFILKSNIYPLLKRFLSNDTSCLNEEMFANFESNYDVYTQKWQQLHPFFRSFNSLPNTIYSYLIILAMAFHSYECVQILISFYSNLRDPSFPLFGINQSVTNVTNDGILINLFHFAILLDDLRLMKLLLDAGSDSQQCPLIPKGPNKDSEQKIPLLLALENNCNNVLSFLLDQTLNNEPRLNRLLKEGRKNPIVIQFVTSIDHERKKTLYACITQSRRDFGIRFLIQNDPQYVKYIFKHNKGTFVRYLDEPFCMQLYLSYDHSIRKKIYNDIITWGEKETIISVLKNDPRLAKKMDYSEILFKFKEENSILFLIENDDKFREFIFRHDKIRFVRYLAENSNEALIKYFINCNGKEKQPIYLLLIEAELQKLFLFLLEEDKDFVDFLRTQEFYMIKSHYFSVVEANDPKHISFFLEKLPDCINRQNELGYTALHIAAKNGQLNIVKLLLASHIDVNIVDKKGCKANEMSDLHAEIKQCIEKHMMPTNQTLKGRVEDLEQEVKILKASLNKTTKQIDILNALLKYHPILRNKLNSLEKNENTNSSNFNLRTSL